MICIISEQSCLIWPPQTASPAVSVDLQIFTHITILGLTAPVSLLDNMALQNLRRNQINPVLVDPDY